MYHEPVYRKFQYTFDLPEKPQDGMVLLDKPGVCRCFIRKLSKELQKFDHDQNYAARPAGSSDLVLEAVVFLESAEHPDWKELPIGTALGEIPGVKRVSVQFTGCVFRMFAGSRVLDENWTFGNTPGIPEDSEPVREPENGFRTLRQPMQYWSPEGMNAWVGDTSAIFFKGRYHLFYLYDRRHHQSKFGTGSHQWGHLSTEDFKTWRDDGVILPIRHAWQGFGTGTPFELDGKLALAYGLHTERFLPEGEAPAGATWATSEDGFHFTPSEIVYAETRNPSVYTGLGAPYTVYCGFATHDLKMLQGERWPEFRTVSEHVVPSGEDSVGRNCLDCPCCFEWNGFYYLLVGFTAMWRSTTPDFREKTDLVDTEQDLYDGSMVPMIVKTGDGRRIMASWIADGGKGCAWGCVLNIRELVWFDDGIPGERWMPEVMPVFANRHLMTDSAVPQDFLLEVEALPGKDLTIRLEGSGTPVELRYFAKDSRAELAFAGVHGTTVKEQAAIDPDFLKHTAFAVKHIRNTEKPFVIRLCIRDLRKLNGILADAEIAGCRTLIRHFGETHVSKCTILGETGKVFLSDKLEA